MRGTTGWDGRVLRHERFVSAGPVPWSAQRRRETELKGGEGQKIFNKENKERGGNSTAPTGAREGPVSLFTGVRRQSSKQELLGVTSEEGAQLTITARWCISGINKAYFAQGACGALAALVSRREGAPVGASGVAKECGRGAAGTRTYRLGRLAGARVS